MKKTHQNINSVIRMISCDRFLFIPIALVVFMLSCKDRKDLVDQPLYDGPISSKDSINTLISDSAKVVMHMQAPRENSFENGDAEWPHGLNLESFGDEGESTTSFQANYVYYNKADNLYRSEGNVIVRNLATGDELNTEELFWNPSEEEFYTDKFVTIKSEDEVHSGEGLKANQDFTSYRILKPTGSFVLEESAQPNPVQ